MVSITKASIDTGKKFVNFSRLTAGDMRRLMVEKFIMD